MTSAQSTLLVQTVCKKSLQKMGWLPNDDIIVNVQGDEPLIPPQVINQVAANLAATPTSGHCYVS
jgi:CMP-2-keto-3-deoxyoctulosonic acid synthetase